MCILYDINDAHLKLYNVHIFACRWVIGFWHCCADSQTCSSVRWLWSALWTTSVYHKRLSMPLHAQHGNYVKVLDSTSIRRKNDIMYEYILSILIWIPAPKIFTNDYSGNYNGNDSDDNDSNNDNDRGDRNNDDLYLNLKIWRKYIKTTYTCVYIILEEKTGINGMENTQDETKSTDSKIVFCDNNAVYKVRCSSPSNSVFADDVECTFLTAWRLTGVRFLSLAEQFLRQWEDTLHMQQPAHWLRQRQKTVPNHVIYRGIASVMTIAACLVPPGLRPPFKLASLRRSAFSILLDHLSPRLGPGPR